LCALSCWSHSSASSPWLEPRSLVAAAPMMRNEPDRRRAGPFRIKFHPLFQEFNLRWPLCFGGSRRSSKTRSIPGYLYATWPGTSAIFGNLQPGCGRHGGDDHEGHGHGPFIADGEVDLGLVA